jgi:hypothetical protein
MVRAGGRLRQGNNNELRNVIRRLADQAMREKYLDQTQEFILRHYSITAIARKWTEIFVELRNEKAQKSGVA